MASDFNFESYLQGINNDTQNILSTDDKATTLQQKTQEKTNNLLTKTGQGYTSDVLQGLYDADTAITSNLGYVREDSPLGNRYDAVELRHGGNPYDMQGITKEERDAGKVGKSTYAMQKQVEQVGQLLGKPSYSVTEQDMIDVGNQQQIQKLADLARTEGEDRWLAPLIRGAEQTNLTGRYIDENGVAQSIPLDVPITSKFTKNIGNRAGGALGNLAGEDVTGSASVDPKQNAFAGSKAPTSTSFAEFLDSNSDTDGRVGETLDMAQSSLTQSAGKVYRLLDKGIEALGLKGVSKNIDEFFGVADAEEKLMDFATRVSDPDHGQAVADQYTGVKVESREDFNKDSAEAEKDWEEGNYLTSIMKTAANLDRYVADSAGPSAELLIPYAGAFVYAANRTQDQAIQYARNNPGKEKSGSDLAKDFGVNLALAVPEKLLIKMGVKNVLPGSNNKAVKTAIAGGGEALQEYGEGVQETHATQKEGDKTLGEILTDPKQVYQGVVGGVVGTGTAGTAGIVGSVPAAGKKAVKSSMEYLDAKFGNLDEGETKEPQETRFGRRNVWESMDNPSFKVEDETSRDIYAKDVAGYVADVLFNKKERADIGYTGGVSIIDDAAKKVAKLYDVDTGDKASMDIVRGEVVRKAYEHMKTPNKQGAKSATDEEIDSYIKDVYAKYGNNKVVEKEIESVYQTEVREKFREMQEGMSNKDVQAMKDVPLTEENYNKIKAIITSMRSLGSESLGTFADKLEEGMKVHQETLGSQGTEGGTKTPKTIEEVANEVMFTGFMELGHRSIMEHKTRMDLDLGRPVGNAGEGSNTLMKYKDFVESRSPANKLTAFYKDKGKVVPRSIGSIRKLIQQMLAENNELADIAENTLKKTTLTDSERTGVEAARDSLKASMDELYELDELGRTYKDYELLDRVSKYRDGKIPAEVLAELDRLRTAEDVDVTETETDFVESTVEDTIEEATRDGKELTVEQRKKIAIDVAKKIYTGEKLTDDDLQFQANYGKDIERILAQKAKMDAKVKAEIVEEVKEEEIVEDPVVEVKEPVTVETVKVKLGNIYDKVRGLKKQITGYKTLEAARKDIGRAEGLRKAAQEEVDKLVSAEKLLQSRIDKASKELQVLKASIGEAYTTIKTKGDTSDRRRFGVEMKKIAKILDKVLGKAARSIRDIAGILESNYASKIDLRADLIENIKEVQSEKKKAIAKLRDAKQKVKVLKKSSPTRKLVKSAEDKIVELVSKTRVKLVGTAGNIFKAKKKSTGSVSEIIANTEGKDTVDTLLNEGARVIRESEDGRSKVESALGTLDKFLEDRKDIGIPKQQKIDLMNKLAQSRYAGQSVADMLNSEDPEVKAIVDRAVGVVSLSMYDDMQGVRFLREEELDDYVDAVFGNLPGSTNGEVDALYASKIKNQLRSGEMVPLAPYTRKAGKMVMKELGVELVDMTLQEVADIERSLGTIAITNLVGTRSNKGVEWKMLTVQNGTVDMLPPSGNASAAAVRVLDLRSLNEETAEAYRNAGMIFEYVNMKDEHGVSLSPTTYKAGKLVRNGNTEISDKALEYLNKQNGYAWKFTSDMKDLIAEVGNDTDKLVELILGTEDDIIANTQVMDIESKLSKYTADKLEIERMVDTYNMVGDKEFYVNWDYIISDRNMISNSQFNPQNSKISRFLASMEDMDNELRLDSEEDIHMAKAAIAQALDMDIDKAADDTVFKELDKLVEISKDGVTFNDSGFEDVVARGTLKALQAWEGKPHGEIMHMYQAVRALRGLMVDGKVKTSLALEIDGITNGMMATLMQTGYTEESRKHFARGGLYFDGEYDNHGQYKEAGGKDVYEAPIGNVTKKFTGREEELISDIIGGKWRNFMKGPVMVFIYGAGMKNIRKAISRSLVIGNSYIAGGMAAGKLDQLLELAGDKLKTNIVPKYVEYNKETGKFEDRLKSEVKNPEMHVYITEAEVEALTNAIEKNIGDKFESGFEETFAGVIKFRKALKTVEQLNYVVFKSEMNKKLMAKGAGRVTDLKPEELTEVYAELLDEGTYYSQTNSLGGEQDYAKFADADGAGMMSVQIPRSAFQSKDTTAASISEYIKELASNVGAIGVTSIHSIDGSVMVTGHKNSVLNIYDALVLGTNAKVNADAATGMNEAFYKLNMEHSILGKSIQKLLNNSDKIDWDLFVEDDVFMEDMRVAVSRIFGDGAELNADTLVGYIDEIHDGRTSMRDTDILVNQYYVSDKLEGYQGKGGDVEVVYTEGEEESQRGRVTALISRMKEEYTKGIANQENIKRRNGIIAEVESILANSPDGKAKEYAIKVFEDMKAKRLGEEC